MIKKALLMALGAVAIIFSACKSSVNEPDQPEVNPEDSAWVTPTNQPYAREDQIAFLSLYSSPEQLLSQGDDDEACAWLWMHETFPGAAFLSFADIKSHTLDSMRVLFWLRDVESGNIEDVVNIPNPAKEAADEISKWYQDGGNIILWSHAVLYIENLGRLPEGTYTSSKHDFACGCGAGHLDLGHWLMSVQLFPGGKFKKDHSTHPLYKDIPIYTDDNLRGFMVKGPGWTEDHNCLFFNYPSEITGRSWQAEVCYSLLKDYYGIIPLGTWDSQINWVSQLNVYELKQGNTEFHGRAICIGNGGCEFSMKNYRQTGVDGEGNPIYEVTSDLSAHPHNNMYQDNILLMARNAVNYMRNGNE